MIHPNAVATAKAVTEEVEITAAPGTAEEGLESDSGSVPAEDEALPDDAGDGLEEDPVQGDASDLEDEETQVDLFDNSDIDD